MQAPKKPEHLSSRLKWGDALVIGLILCLASFLFLIRAPGSDGAGVAVITRDGKVLERIALGANGQTLHFIVDGDYHNEIMVSGGRICFSESDCPDKVCVHTGWLSKPGQTAVCLPNRVVITIEGAAQLDAVSK